MSALSQLLASRLGSGAPNPFRDACFFSSSFFSEPTKISPGQRRPAPEPHAQLRPCDAIYTRRRSLQILRIRKFSPPVLPGVRVSDSLSD